MIDFTNAFNNISYLYQHQQRDVIQYHFMLHGYHINVAYTKCAGLSRQISVTFETGEREVIFLPIRITKKGESLLISAMLGNTCHFYTHFLKILLGMDVFRPLCFSRN